MKTFKYRIYPNKETSLLLNIWFGQTRFVWNYYLNQRTVAYKEAKKSLSYNDNAKDLTQLKKQDEYSWLKECPSQALQQQLKVLDSAFKDFLHKISTKLISENQVIAVEDLKVKNLIRNKKLSKHIANASWGRFLTFLEYKALWYGRELRKLDKFFPSSKMCNACGYIKEDLKLSDRTITCKGCGAIYDRDINASKNILQFSVVG